MSALPRAASKRSAARRRIVVRAGWITTSPAALTANYTGIPGRNCKASRMGLGIVTCPLLVNVVFATPVVSLERRW
jgi:hypothetical protein